MEDWQDRSAITIYYLPYGNSTAGARDPFNVVADNLDVNGSLPVNATFESTTQLIQIITNTAPIARDFTVEIEEGGINSYYFPSQSEYLIDPDGGRENIEAEIMRIEIVQSSSNPPIILVRECIGCHYWAEILDITSVVDIKQGKYIASSRHALFFS